MASPDSPRCAVCESHEETVFRIDGMDCPNEVAILERRLKHLPGIHEMRADVLQQRLHVSHDAATLAPAAIAQAVAETGMRAFVEQGQRARPRSALDGSRAWLLGGSAALVALALISSRQGWSSSTTMALSLGASALAAPWTVPRALASIRTRSLDMHVLMAIAVTGAMLLGDWVEAATVTFLFAVAQWLEQRSLDRARHAIGALVMLAPADATVRRDGAEQRVSVSALVPGDVILVRPGEKIAVDGVVLQGDSDVNQAPVTGESVPVTKSAGDAVFAGTINGHGGLEVRVTRAGRDSTLARIIHLVEEAQSKRAPAQSFVDRFARLYTPAVVVVAMLIAIVPPLLLDQPVQDWVYRALVLLVIACPCALVISTPVSVVSALATAARHGVLVKGGVHLERAAQLRSVAFDKTGTLTHGRLAVERVVPLNGHGGAEILAMAAALERRSEHPIGRAIVRHAERGGVRPGAAETFQALPGRGARGRVEGHDLVVGNHRLFHETGLCSADVHAHLEAAEARGRTSVFLARDGEPVGIIDVADEARANGADAIAALRAAGVGRVVVVTGDSHRTAEAIAQGLPVDEVHAELLPEDKVRVMDDLRARYGTVAMVGDGVNDAPALAAADLGIAMGAAGSDAALETADVALMGDDLSKVAFLVRLGRATLFNIKTNIAVALGLKAVFLALAMAGQATLWMAVAADMGASLLVIGNGLRLLRAR